MEKQERGIKKREEDLVAREKAVKAKEAEVMKLKNLGKTSLTEIKSRLAEKGLSLGMPIKN